MGLIIEQNTVTDTVKLTQNLNENWSKAPDSVASFLNTISGAGPKMPKSKLQVVFNFSSDIFVYTSSCSTTFYFYFLSMMQLFSNTVADLICWWVNWVEMN